MELPALVLIETEPAPVLDANTPPVSAKIAPPVWDRLIVPAPVPAP
jgi:hypothetical protein